MHHLLLRKPVYYYLYLTMTLSELDRQILDLCATPHSSREVATELGANLKTVQWALGKLRTAGMVVSKRHPLALAPYTVIKYETIPGAKPPEPKKEYKPLGICVLGVWL